MKRKIEKKHHEAYYLYLRLLIFVKSFRPITLLKHMLITNQSAA